MRKHPVGNLGSRFRDQRSKSNSSNYSINFSAKKFIILGYVAGHWSAPGVGGRDQSGVTKTRGSIKGRRKVSPRQGRAGQGRT